ncbi:MAG: MgtC/SapB family protein [Alphaproteobacteria bacterium]|nr:MgtC/SapB family protein [Alphaproteobacteria bacterium]
MDFETVLSRVALALGIGLLIGLERGWRSRDATAGSRAAGIRTFAISGFLGGVVGILADRLGGAESPGGGIAFGISFAAYAIAITVFSRDANRFEKSASATTAIAGMLTFALGAYAVLGDMRIAAGAGVATAGLLAIRQELHGWVAKITWTELRSGLVLLAMTFIALPVLPDDPIGPFGGVNPREVWLIAIVLACVSFAGYVAVKVLGSDHGVLLAAAAGGLVSSTAVTVTNAQRARAGESAPRLLAAGVAVATAVSFLRVLVIVGTLKGSLLPFLAPALIAAAAVATGFGLISVYSNKSRKRDGAEAKVRNPFSFWSVISFAAILSAVMLLARAMSEMFGSTGAIISSAVVGLADVDAATIAVARLVPGSLTELVAATAILLAVASNTVSKIAIGATTGGGSFAVGIALMSGLCFAAAGLALGATFAFTKM